MTRNASSGSSTKRKWLIAGIVIGSILTAAPLLGMVGTAIGMMRAFSALGSTGISDPHALSEAIGTSLLSTATGFFVFPVGVLILTVSLVLFVQLRKATPPPLPERRPDEAGVS